MNTKNFDQALIWLKEKAGFDKKKNSIAPTLFYSSKQLM